MGRPVLADLGADVIKVERSRTGDVPAPARVRRCPQAEGNDGQHLPAPPISGTSTNRGKRSVEADFETEAGVATIVKKLAARSDVLIENWKVGGLAKFGLDYKSLAPDCRGWCSCSVTGFGQDGPYAQRPRRLRPSWRRACRRIHAA